LIEGKTDFQLFVINRELRFVANLRLQVDALLEKKKSLVCVIYWLGEDPGIRLNIPAKFRWPKYRGFSTHFF
jgi:hypothetical protein